MKAGWSSAASASSYLSQVTLTLLLIIALTTGCGSSGSTQPPKFSGNTSVTVLLSSTANDQVTRFHLQFQTLTLTSQSGKTVTLLSSPQPSEFMHLNGGIEPLTTVTIPQDIYTSATVTLGGAVYVCIAQVPGGGLGIANYSIVNQGPAVSLQSPITVTGSSMALLLNMQVSSSAVFPTCWTTPPFEGFSMTPTFNLTPMALSTSPTNSGNGKVSGLKAEIASVGTTGSTLTLTVPGGPFGTRTLTASSNSTTVFQGVSGASALSPGMFLDVDGAIQSDGSLLATRIEVENSSAVNLLTGPVISVGAPLFMHYGRMELGPLYTINGQSGYYLDTSNFDFSNAIFKTSGQFTNLQNLPFVPSFSGSNMVPGQEVDITPPTLPIQGGVYPPAETITLAPQTINGTIVGSQQTGNFTDYTVSLASYDLFPTLAEQQGQTTVLNNPSQVEVYVDSNTLKLNTQALAAGNTLRFYGLVFNDNGTLRMDCAQVNDGVTGSSQTNSGSHVRGQIRIEQQEGPGLRTITTITSSD
ncbi:MAG TPA: DUF5666 domain-containing protein [Candidatus Dormibacteraeota bacterium]|nr:DUF5666 domain-containing protein [Candidatus Dormibacteraeota bacterium]